MKNKKNIFIVCSSIEQIGKMFDLVVELSEKQIVRRTYSKSKGTVITKDCVIDIQMFDNERLRGVRYDHIVNLSNIHDGYLKSMLNPK